MSEELKSKFEELIENSFFNINGPNTTEETILILKAAYDMAKADEWVSVADRLPETVGLYLCYHEDGEIEVNAFFQTTTSRVFYRDYNVTHWQPLPTPPNQ